MVAETVRVQRGALMRVPRANAPLRTPPAPLQLPNALQPAESLFCVK